jgi:hypothetical protein
MTRAPDRKKPVRSVPPAALLKRFPSAWRASADASLRQPPAGQVYWGADSVHIEGRIAKVGIGS